ncbi:MAG: 50S ribosomal protein L13 [Candidatus Altiarchaeales archaeon]|nr:MAG: 50S ribosomal protein L13 [Candidatus Altiarchaeales archaeon]
MIINAEGHILGRLCTFVAKKALLGEDVIVVNAEKAVISGNKDVIFRKELEKLKIRNLGNPRKGPFHQKRPDRFVRRSIRGMLPWRKSRGREAFKRVMVYIGIPEEEIRKRHNIDIKKAKIEDLNEMKKDIKGITVGEVCRFIGGKF